MVVSVPLRHRTGKVVSDVAIIGGGLAGGAAATLLARSGTRVRLFEREARAHDKICGEFLSIEAQRDLERLGIDTGRLGAVAIDRMRLTARDRVIETPLPFVAQGVSRRLLDEALLEMAAKAGARIERGVRVNAVEGHDISTSTGPCRAGQILLATGKHDVRAMRRSEPITQKGYVGFKMHWRPSARQRAEIDRAIELVLFDGGYAGLQLVAADVLNLCLIVRRDRLAAEGGSWDGLLAGLMREPGIARRLGDAEALFARPLTIANLPYGFVCGAEPFQPNHIFRLGDQAAMTASLTGDGMAVALRSAHVAAASLLAGEDAATYHARMRRLVSRQVRRAMLLQRATEAPLAMAAGFALLSLWPRLLGALASATRLPRWRSA
jgi:flavin-dependent dehydrogenase